MKKIIALVMALAMMTVTFASCNTTNAGGDDTTKAGDDTTAAVTEEYAGTLLLGFDAEYPPYGYLDTETNEYTGFDIEFAKAVCEKINYKLTLVPINWEAKDTALASGEINCIWSGFTIQGREDDYAWTVPYSDSRIVVLTAADSGITALTDLAEKIVSVQADSSGEASLKDMAELVATFKDGVYQTCADYTNAFVDLEAGAVDALVIDIGVAQKLIEGKDGYVILEEPISIEQYGVGFAKDNTELRDIISNAMVELADVANEIAAKYGIADSISIKAAE